MKPEWAKALNEMRNDGYAVIVWTPEELGDADPRKVEDFSISYGWDYLVPAPKGD